MKLDRPAPARESVLLPSDGNFLPLDGKKLPMGGSVFSPLPQ